MRPLKPLYTTDHHEIPLPPGHKFPLQKYRMVRELLARDGLFAFCPAEFGELSTIRLAHDADYVAQFMSGTLAPSMMRRIGFPWSEGLIARTLSSVGATLAATREALATGWGGSLAGGTHHAFRAEGSGFCVFNDIAVAICDLFERDAIKRAAVVDLDVHQGDGTAEIFEGDERVFTLSIHSKTNFPFRKKQSRLDIELHDGVEDEVYLRTLDSALPSVFSHEPDIVFYQSGVDGLWSDALGHLRLTHEGLIERDRRVFESVCVRGIPIVVTIGGGYSKPIERTVEAHANTYRTAAEVFCMITA
ncbi:MAG: histone deacetylase [Acidobacteriales bacterium]|nr:histone deacetylase [Terriglobales bacterium]